MTGKGRINEGDPCTIKDTSKFHDVRSYQISRQYISYLSNSSHSTYYVIPLFFLSFLYFICFFLPLFHSFIFCLLCFSFFSSCCCYLHISLLGDSAGISVVQKKLKIVLHILHYREWNCSAGGGAGGYSRRGGGAWYCNRQQI
jgi:hypothetical protein